MKLRYLRQLALQISKTFSGHVLKLERDLVRTWDGCVYYLLRHRGFLLEIWRSLEILQYSPATVADASLKPPLPPIAAILTRLEQRS
jgi:hypothetical protein